MSTVAKQHVVQCPECGAPMTLRSSKFGLFYGCSQYPNCKATHGAHPDGKPLGTPANAVVKQARIAAHKAFDQLWSGPKARLTRDEAYLWLQSKMGLTSAQAHIGSFDQAQCDKLIQLVRENEQ